VRLLGILLAMPSKPRPHWTDERILAAVHAWTAETGDPPRSYEWSPATARSLGLYNERTARWERDWPRWPGTDTLRYHFGRFNQALEAAGFPARPLLFELALPERVEAARRLAAAGEPTVVIADHLDVHPATVRNYLCARSCRDCGTAVVSGAELCLRCALERRRERAWTPAEIVEALRARTAETGRPPTTSEWDSGERAAPKWRRERDRWPTAQLVRSRFGSWDAALRAAGYRARSRGHTPDVLIAALRQEAGRLGRPPAQREWATASPHRPNASSVVHAFGSWTAGLRAAGLEPLPRRRWSDADIVAALRAWTARRGRPPLFSNWRRAAEDHPTAALAQVRFGTWRAALEAAGVAPRRMEWTRERVLEAIRAHIDRHGHAPLSSDWRRPEGDEVPATHVVINRLSSWRAAIAASRD
jgi:hypothetical protein